MRYSLQLHIIPRKIVTSYALLDTLMALTSNIITYYIICSLQAITDLNTCSQPTTTNDTSEFSLKTYLIVVSWSQGHSHILSFFVLACTAVFSAVRTQNAANHMLDTTCIKKK